MIINQSINQSIKLPEVYTTRFDETESEKIVNILQRHASSFSQEDEIGFSDTVQHKVNTYDDSPMSQPYRRIPLNQLMEVKAHIQKLLDQGVIKPSHSPYATQIVLARKDGSSGCAQTTDVWMPKHAEIPPPSHI